MNICPVGAELFHADRTDGRTDRYYDAKSLFAIVRTRLIIENIVYI
jgi:hypothetical protein